MCRVDDDDDDDELLGRHADPLALFLSADDGKLSLDEFQAFFSDGTLNEEELEKLFHTIDSDNTRLLCQTHGETMRTSWPP
ncbi:hypothetical protein SKAU_G00345220 [Synaphobranchus kaupii]|uniref:EF-hand domain-containing protein n=1 Tax=Synaphobranchus kaupii TaxID=118154 RepID=A0A9Q1EJA6_SYNKA|nr:hypothetical protein SKAU_G00345220 [Synaphobranchus kaupii]